MRVYEQFCLRFYDACKSKWPAKEYGGLPLAFCEASVRSPPSARPPRAATLTRPARQLDTVSNVTMIVSEDTNNVFMRWGPNHCDGTITGGPVRASPAEQRCRPARTR